VFNSTCPGQGLPIQRSFKRWMGRRPTAIVCVPPPEFELPTGGPADVLLPQALDEAEQATRKVATLVWAVARLKEGVTFEQARAALQPLYEQSLQAVSPQFRKVRAGRTGAAVFPGRIAGLRGSVRTGSGLA